MIKEKEPLVSIGLPTYNRPELLALALECFRAQTFKEFELIISDNASPDPRVEALCLGLANSDSRFKYIRQTANQGSEANFWYVYDKARAPLFLWASDDDLWPSDFLAKGIEGLQRNPEASAWFCQVANINAAGDVIRTYPSFSRFQSSSLKVVDLARFLWEPEILGKANIIYSIYRRPALAEVIDKFRNRPSSWGSDMNLVFGFLCRFNLIVDDTILLRKRVPDDIIERTVHPRTMIYPWTERKVYFLNYRRVASSFLYTSLTSVVLTLRFLYDYWFNGKLTDDYQNSRIRHGVVHWRSRWAHRFRELFR